MRVADHRLTDTAVDHLETANHGGPFTAGQPDTLILHFTAGDSIDWAIRTLCDPTPGQRVSAHVVVARDGHLTQLLPFDTVAWHAGRSTWGGRHELNRVSLGIEIDNAGRLEPQRPGVYTSWQGSEYGDADATSAVHRNESSPSWWQRYPAPQLAVVEQLCRRLVAEYRLRWILGHEEVAPSRKHDPGPAFPLDEIRARLWGPCRRKTQAGDIPT